MTIIDGCIALFIFACSIFVMTCNPDGVSLRNMEKVATTALIVIAMLITAAFTYLAFI